MKRNNPGGRYSAAPKRKRNPAKRKQSRLILSLSLVAILLAVLVGFMILYAFPANDFKDLSEQVQAAAETAPTLSDAAVTTAPVEETAPTVTVPAEIVEALAPVEKTMLPQYGNLFQQNPDLYGWVRIDDTIIDYPVMRSVDDPEKYLHANFEAEYSYPGTPFVDSKCSNDSDNILIYAHNMLDGSMFRSLLKYENKNYWEAHPTIMYSDLYGEYEYEVLAAFYDRVYKKTENVFKFYQFIDAEDASHYNNAIDNFKAKALYDTGVDAVYGDQLITLITCAYHTDNGRFVVVARKITE